MSAAKQPEPIITQATLKAENESKAEQQRVHDEALRKQNQVQAEHGLTGVASNAVVGERAPVGGSQASDSIGNVREVAASGPAGHAQTTAPTPAPKVTGQPK